MRRTATLELGALLTIVLSVNSAEAQEESHSHIRHVLQLQPETLEEAGFLTKALGEAAIAREHAGYAAGGVEDVGDLGSIQTHAAHVLHAVDPTKINGGPGFGFGVKPAAEKVVYHIKMAGASADATENVRTHAEYVAISVQNTVERAERMIELIGQIHAASSAEDAEPLADDLEALSRQLRMGMDTNGDGAITWQEGEGGLEQAKQHMELMMKREGMEGRGG